MGKVLAVIENSKTLTRHSYYASDYDWIYETMMGLTGNDHEISAEAACWCEDAPVGSVFEFRNGTITLEES